MALKNVAVNKDGHAKENVKDSLWNPSFYSNSSQTPSNLISLTILVTLRPFTLF